MFQFRSLLRLRSFATQTTSTSTPSLRLTFALPHQTLYQSKPVHQVNIHSTEGSMGILASHVPTIEQLIPSVIEIIHSTTEKKSYFVSSGFAVMNPDSTLNISAVEAFELDSIDMSKVKVEVERLSKIKGKDEKENAEIRAEMEVYNALEVAMKK